MTAPWLDRRLLVCVGAGGVGKTTVSAAIALAAARAGRRALVLTVDPARRLAGALGLSALPGQPAPVPAAALAAAGLDTGGRLDAMMLDQAGAWDRLIARHADDAARARLADSRFFRALSQRFAGATEYLALDELAELTGSGDHDLIVLDTPPGERAIDLLGAPARARALLDPRVLHFLGGAGRLIPGGLEAAAGGAALLELFGVLSATADVADALAARAAAARAALTDPGAGVLVVAAPDDRAIAGAGALATRIAALGLDVAGAVVNRVHAPWPASPPPDRAAVAAALAAAGVADHAAWLAATFVGHEHRARGEARRIAALAAALPAGVPLCRVPAQDVDVHDLRGLAAMAAAFDRPGS